MPLGILNGEFVAGSDHVGFHTANGNRPRVGDAGPPFPMLAFPGPDTLDWKRTKGGVVPHRKRPLDGVAGSSRIGSCFPAVGCFAIPSRPALLEALGVVDST